MARLTNVGLICEIYTICIVSPSESIDTLYVMIPISSSLLVRGSIQSSSTVGLTRLLAFAPSSSNLVGTASAPTQSSLSFTIMSAFAIAISYADRYVCNVFKMTYS